MYIKVGDNFLNINYYWPHFSQFLKFPHFTDYESNARMLEN